MHAFDLKTNAVIIVTLAISLTACMVGPNFRSPPPPVVKRYTESAMPKKTMQTPKVVGGQAQTFVTNKDIPLLWWDLYHSEPISELVKAGIANNQDLAAARAALKQAVELVKVQVGNSLFPAINTTDYAQRQRFSTVAIGQGEQAVIFNLFNSSVNISYTLDVFGGARRQIESLKAQVDYQQYEMLATYLTLTSNIVTTAIAVANYNAQIEATEELIKIETGVLGVLNKQYELGGISKADVLTQQTTLEQTKATLPPLKQNLSLAKHSLAALTGVFPDSPLPTINLNSLKLPRELPVTLPSTIVRQRPDILASEALLHAASANIGVATASLFPVVNITGANGWIGTVLSSLFTPQTQVWNLLGQVTQPFYQGGALLANRRAKIDAYQQAEAQYRQTVIKAFQNVADTLKALEHDAQTLQAQSRAERAAKAALDLTLTQYRLGGINYINLLNAQQQYQRTRLSLIQAQATRFSDTAALFQALGGGWWNPTPCVTGCALNK